MGDQINLSGHFQGTNLNIKSSLQQVTQTIAQLPTATKAEQASLSSLLEQLNDALQQLPKDRAEEAEAIAQMAAQLLTNANQVKPNKTMLDITGKGLKEAAKAIVGIVPSALEVVTLMVKAVANITASP